jgi:hypothetical protein
MLKFAGLCIALLAFEPIEYIFPIESEVTPHLDVREGIGIADFCALACLLINPGGFDLQALGDLGGSKYLVHRGVRNAPLCAN